MIIYLKHPENGHMPVYDMGEVERLAKFGWTVDAEYGLPVEPTVIEPAVIEPAIVEPDFVEIPTVGPTHFEEIPADWKEIKPLESAP